ncbi:MAG: ATP-binding protein [Bacteroidales bacterium]|nr:ATP-binding protein [Bacteroidales bacterium]
MIERTVYKELKAWKNNPKHKPLILRGARQVGKTTLVNQFSAEFDNYLYLNLDRKRDLQLFQEDDITNLVDNIYIHCGKRKSGNSTLLFIDEIQNSPEAVKQLRYFYEEMPNIHVIAAGSLLESLINNHISFPVGRVEYMMLRPCTFVEFLKGIGEDFDAGVVQQLKGDAIHERLMNYFKNYIAVGGMPEAVTKYAERRDVLAVTPIYSSFINAYSDDVEKYSRNNTQTAVIRHIIAHGWNHAAEAITFNNFAGSNYRSREVGEAFRTIEKALLMELVYPVSEPLVPLLPNLKRKPKLLWLDTGLVNYYAGIRNEIFSTNDIMTAWRGHIAEHIAGQELAATSSDFGKSHHFWVRDKEGSSAEVDFVYQYENMAIPVEVKSGTNAHLRSLNAYMDLAPHDIAIRIWSGRFSIDNAVTAKGKTFRLVNLPFYYVGQIDNVIRKL